MASQHRVREIHVVCNTHWDREFRETLEVTRRALVDMLDITLDVLESDPRYASYTLDGHAIMVEDYLEMRPEQRPRIERLLRERRLFIGPWYTLPDAMNVGGEALVRNFLRARAVASELGATWLRAGYSPNNWGQPSQMPQIFRGFGIDNALIYRGISPHECPAEFIWVGADGSEILGHRFARLARYNWYYLVFRPSTRGVEPTDKNHPLAGSREKPFRVCDGRSRGAANFRLLDPSAALDRTRLAAAIEAMLDLEGPDSSTGLFLAMHGHDMSVAHPQDAQAVAAAAAALAGKYVVRLSNLEDFMAQVRDELDPQRAVRLTGERRMNLKEGFWTYLLPCTISARTYLKVLNTEAENALVGEAEPLSCLAASWGGVYPARYFARAWRFLLGNHTHDANAGCAPDRVCADMEYRYRQCLDIAGICSEDALRHLAGNLRPLPGADGQVHLLVANPLAQDRDAVLDIEVVLPQPAPGGSLEVADETGQVCAVQVSSRQADAMFVDNIWDVPTIARVEKYRLKVRVPDLPALGYRAFTVRSRTAAESAPGSLRAGPCVLENEYLRAEIRPDGSVDLLHHSTGRWYRGLNTFRDQGEAGNAWQQAAPRQDEIIASAGGVAELTNLEEGPLSAALRASVTMLVPADGADGTRRSTRRMPLQLDVVYSLRAGDPGLHVDLSFDNCARDHWLRAVFPTGVNTNVARADTHFDLVERPITHPDDTGWIEPFRGTAPMHSVVDLSDGTTGLALLTCGLFEYEAFDDPQRVLALSLVRSFPIKLQVSEEKMEVLPDTGVQCPGPQSFRYALLPHAGDAIAGEVLLWAQRFNNPPRAAQVTPTDGRLPARFSLAGVEGTGLIVTAVKHTEHSTDLLIRLFNADTQAHSGRVRFGRPVAQAWSLRLDETPLAALAVADDGVDLTVGPKKIVTLRIVWAESGRQFEGIGEYDSAE